MDPRVEKIMAAADYIAATQSPGANSEVVEGTAVYVKFVKRETN